MFGLLTDDSNSFFIYLKLRRFFWHKTILKSEAPILFCILILCMVKVPAHEIANISNSKADPSFSSSFWVSNGPNGLQLALNLDFFFPTQERLQFTKIEDAVPRLTQLLSRLSRCGHFPFLH